MTQQVLTLCGSMQFIEEMESIAAKLVAAGWTVHTPQREEAGFRWESVTAQEQLQVKKAYIDEHLDKIRGSTAVLITNYPKNGTNGYIGANTLMEAAMAYTLGVPVYFLFPIGAQGCQLEAESIVEGVWNGRINLATLNQ
ncbi:hypothetical protein [Candidatus Leptofilum sp.]|uniref:hypothetical protein n=1 Tax=Candidatus Leptofilum sp. TaxID=3241576 RepID=UPI003B5BEF97